MRAARLVTRDPKLAERLRRVLEGTLDVVETHGDPLAIGQMTPLPLDFVLLDFGSTDAEPGELAALRARHPAALLIGLLPAEAGELVSAGAAHCDFVVPIGLSDAMLRTAIGQAVRLQRLGYEVASLRHERVQDEVKPAPAAPNAGAIGSLGTVLKEMGKLLAAHFDLERVVDFFLDAIAELVRPGRAAVLLADEEQRYRIRGQRGLDPALAEHVRLDPAEGLPAWFRQHARPATRRELVREPEWLEAARELAVLGGEVAVPLWVQSKLVGILALGPRVTGQPYVGEDLERLFTLASQVAVAVEDISLFNTVRAQASFIEQVLAHLQSGAVTIDSAGRVTLFNRRAEEILGLPRNEVLGQDLRALPSPLGDLLFEAVRDGRELRLQEVTLPRRPTLPLEVSTSRILGPTGAPVGAVMILDDPAPRHLLHRERQTTQALDLLNRVLLRLTDEIKNPLVSIYTFLELLPQRYDDPEFRERFFAVVGRDTKHLISLVDKLIVLAGEREYKLDFCDVRELVNDALADLALRLERPRASQDAAIFLLEFPDRSDRLTAVLYTPEIDLLVKADRDQLGKALGYLLRFVMDRVEADGRVAIHALPDPDHPRTVRLSILGKPATLAPAERERLFSPLAIASERLFDVGPSVSQKIVEAHGGTLAVSGGEGEIRFVVTLPRSTPQ
ncbi:MAG TPA: PAS domain-containing protein [Methylomirabilota bacterium]|jgi:PAS domain S-box-containing protein|nr:PAS domain-containing protein [Methylomirabilota bacterium]